MHKAVVHLQEEFAGVRTGRATPALVEKLKVDYYGTESRCSSSPASRSPSPASS